MADIQTIQAGEQTIAVRKDLRVPMRDGVPSPWTPTMASATSRGRHWWR
ncbi:hypothetical protein ACFQ0B_46875 [Nonomuraea thailandensis]